jgi:hypothetical protein
MPSFFSTGSDDFAPLQGGNIQGMKFRIYADPVMGLHNKREIHRFAVDRDQVYFSGRDAQQFQYLFNCGPRALQQGKPALPQICRQVTVQSGIDSVTGGSHGNQEISVCNILKKQRSFVL